MSFECSRTKVAQSNQPRYQWVFVSWEIFPRVYKRSSVYTKGGVLVGPEESLVSLASIVPFGRDETSPALS